MDNLIAKFKNGEAQLNDLSDHHAKMKTYYLDINYVLISYDRQYYKESL